MASKKIDLRGLLRNAASDIANPESGMRDYYAFCLAEAADNLDLVANGDATSDEAAEFFCFAYTHQERRAAMTATSPYLTRPLRSEIQARFDATLSDAGTAGNWPMSRTPDPIDEISRQESIGACAAAIIAAAMDCLVALAERSAGHQQHVICDQEDWAQIWRDAMSDAYGDTFGCLPNAIERAKREAS